MPRNPNLPDKMNECDREEIYFLQKRTPAIKPVHVTHGRRIIRVKRKIVDLGKKLFLGRFGSFLFVGERKDAFQVPVKAHPRRKTQKTSVTFLMKEGTTEKLKKRFEIQLSVMALLVFFGLNRIPRTRIEYENTRKYKSSGESGLFRTSADYKLNKILS